MRRIRFSLLTVASTVLLGAFSMTALSQDLLTQKVLSLDLAQTIAQAAVVRCRADGAGLGTNDISRRKAYTAVIFERTSAEMGKNFAATTPPPTFDGTIFLAGGVPIKAGEEVIGAIGVSGAPGGDK